MKLEKLVGERFRERPSDCIVDSHAFMVRGGYLKYVANGIYSSYMLLKRVTRKIEQILREEMDAIDGQEIQFPVVIPASLWQESGRYESIGKELMRFQDRNGSPLVLGMTHEEAAVQLVRDYGQSYSKYPFMIYQIQTKFRDEARPRAGLIRVREFTMKDAYSFHMSKEDLEEYYNRFHKAYERIYGIGVGRLAAAICEAHHDEYGPIWPMSVAPWQIHLCAVRSDNAEVKAYADKLYEELQGKGIEIIYDDRNVSAGVMFSDADLLGVPLRMIVSPRNMKQGIVEMISRDKSFSASFPMESVCKEISKIVEQKISNLVP